MTKFYQATCVSLVVFLMGLTIGCIVSTGINTVNIQNVNEKILEEVQKLNEPIGELGNDDFVTVEIEGAPYIIYRQSICPKIK